MTTSWFVANVGFKFITVFTNLNIEKNNRQF